MGFCVCRPRLVVAFVRVCKPSLGLRFECVLNKVRLWVCMCINKG